MSASLPYDAFGRRIRNAAGTNFVYDGFNAVQELSGTAVTANPLTGLTIDEVFSRTDSGGTWSFLTDALGSTRALTDSTGTVQVQYNYEPFGKMTVSGPASSNPFQYTGRENDGTGMYYYRLRYYSPALQRFISEDPMQFAGGINFYMYVDDDPVRFFDPLGLDKTEKKKPSCYVVWYNAVGDTLNPFSPSLGSLAGPAGEVYGATNWNQALSHAASRDYDIPLNPASSAG